LTFGNIALGKKGSLGVIARESSSLQNFPNKRLPAMELFKPQFLRELTLLQALHEWDDLSEDPCLISTSEEGVYVVAFNVSATSEILIGFDGKHYGV
jgi:hypothetical protein